MLISICGSLGNIAYVALHAPKEEVRQKALTLVEQYRDWAKTCITIPPALCLVTYWS